MKLAIAKAHDTAALAVGILSLAIVRSKITRRDLERAVGKLEEALRALKKGMGDA